MHVLLLSGSDRYMMFGSPRDTLSFHVAINTNALFNVCKSAILLLSLFFLNISDGFNVKITIAASIANIAITIMSSTNVKDFLTTVEYCRVELSLKRQHSSVTIPRGHHVKFLTLSKLKVFHCDDFFKLYLCIRILFRILED